MLPQRTSLDTGELASRLRRVVSDAIQTEIVGIENFVPLSGGASRETWAFTAVDDGGRRCELILQRLQSLLLTTALGASTEAALIAAAAAVGVPVPALLAHSDDPQALQAPYLLLAKVSGESIPQRLLRRPEYSRARGRLAEDYGAALGRIHSIPLVEVPGLMYQDPLDHWANVLRRTGEARPALEFGLRWLARNDPRSHDDRVTVVHGDYRNGNGIVDREGLRAVIDWELAHTGDPREDLGWFCIRAWRFGSQLPVGGLGTYKQFLGAYKTVTGVDVTPEELLWWRVLGSLRWAVICINQGMTHLKGHRRSLELAAVGRRACEAEFDMLTDIP